MKKHIIYIILLLLGWNLQAQVVLSDKNYIHTTVPQVGMTIAELENVNCANINDIDKAIESVTYFDGLGRPIQERAIKASPDGKDIVTHIEYDAYGRQAKQYLPFEADNTIGSYKEINVNTDINQYYKDTYASDFPGITDLNQINAYSESLFDGSPLNRVIKVGAPGTAWKANPSSDADHAIKTDWYTNTANEVVYHKVVFANPSDTEKPSLVQDGYYGANQLYITITQDENWTPADGNNHTTKEYKDKQGRVVLKRTYNAGAAHDTYYVYDRFGKLTYVISPKVNVADGVSESELSELCYQYHYDYRNRLIEKKVPGKDWEYIVYNKLDQPIMTQDASLRKEMTGKAWNQWLFTKYDAFGRVLYTGTVINGANRKVIQNNVNNATTPQYESKLTSPIAIGGTTVYYSKDAYPTSIYKVFTINYYDDYNFDLAGLTNPGTAYGKTISDQTKTLPTGSKVRVLETNDWITTVTRYDNKSRPIYVASKNEYLNTTDIVESKLDFVGKVEETKTTHTKGSNAAIVTIDTFTYDHMGRPLTQTQKINNQAVETIVENRYDKLGKLESKKTGGGLQEVNYTYNVRGWLTKINDPNANLGNKLFAFKINYNNPQHGATPLFNGNISETTWKTANDNVKRHYKYSYDALNRITGADYNNQNNSEQNWFKLSGITYDKNGNIGSLKRYKKGGANQSVVLDHLAYTYNEGNKLLTVEEQIDGAGGFEDGTNTGNDYSYDKSGNMTIDNNKNITGIIYNHLNLPTRVNVDGGAKYISYIYDAAGTKLKKVAKEGSSLIAEYAGNYVYKNGALEFFNHSEGIVEHEADGYKYVYQYRDHLDNIRLSYKDANKDGAISQDEIIQEKHYYPFGLQHEGYNGTLRGRNHNYGFGNKEEQNELSLGWIDITARNYDPALGRWMNLDPLAEKMRRFSPYTYAFDNPIFFIDPDGMEPCPNGDCDTKINPFPQPVSHLEPFMASKETLNLIEEGKQLLSEAFSFNASAKGKLGVGGNVKVGPVNVAAEANAISITGKIDKDKVETKTKIVDVKGSITVGPKDSDSNITAYGTFNVANINLSVDENLNTDGSIENGGFDGDVITGSGNEVKLSTKDFLNIGIGGKIGPLKVSGSANLYNLAKGLGKTILGGANYLKDYAVNVFK
ncbi:hypothetical protein ATO12_19360 [Aquimarina atlantica]|uniref:DUF6443 domain-containing protein n=1 Tax=Aquimarina atlantica TaxID=1317122 RepID=A0A023BT33_9FLAO|nr:DUF6443 domain-containing protein [Aquimarina atlantica]EZH73166.1 hypothetical protein ATO12_19360 [Aquimarina atlantica]